MPIQIVRDDITRMKVDAIVNAANTGLQGGGGVDGAIHRAAGPGLLEECRQLNGCAPGQAKRTAGYRLPARYVIHTVGPIWKGGHCGEEDQLISCYRSALSIAINSGCKTVAFPLISTGSYGYPKAEALKVAMKTISAFLEDHELMVYLVIYDKASFGIAEDLYADIKSRIDDLYVEERKEFERPRPDSRRREDREGRGERGLIGYFGRSRQGAVPAPDGSDLQTSPRSEDEAHLSGAAPKTGAARPRSADEALIGAQQSDAMLMSDIEHFDIAGPMGRSRSKSLDQRVHELDESFTQMLLRKIDEAGMTDVECYKKANVSRKLFSKIRSDALYRPSKTTAIAFAIALELSLQETKELLMKAGFALSHSNRFDIIIEYFIERGNYNIFEINEALFAFDQSLLGA